MTKLSKEKQWVSSHAERVEEYFADWRNLFDKRAWNKLTSTEAQEEYEARLKDQAKKPRHRAWVGETFYEISKSSYDYARSIGIPTVT